MYEKYDDLSITLYLFPYSFTEETRNQENRIDYSKVLWKKCTFSSFELISVQPEENVTLLDNHYGISVIIDRRHTLLERIGYTFC